MLYNLISYIIISVSFTLYKYTSIKENLQSYNSGIESLGNFVTNSNVKPPYLKIFISSFIIIVIINIVKILVLKKINKISYKECLKKTYDNLLYIIVIIAMASIILINRYIGLILLTTYYTLNSLLKLNKFNNTKSKIVLSIDILLFIVLYKISS